MKTENPYRTILCCTDFSPNADHAFEYAVGSAVRHAGCALVLLHVLPEPEAQFWKSYLAKVDGVDDKAKADIDKKINDTYRPRVPADVNFQTAFRIGNPAQTILDYAKEIKADLIVIGRQGHGAVFFGNVTTRVVRYSPCPVLVVPLSNN